MKKKYLYAIVKNSKVGNFDGLFTVCWRSLSAVAADKQYRDYSTLTKAEVVKDLIEHQQQIETIMKSLGTVLPVKFGTYLKDDQEIMAVLQKGYSFLCQTLKKMKDKIELDLVCFWHKQKAAQLAYQESIDIQQLQTKLSRQGSVTFKDKICLGKLVSKYLAKKKKELTEQILTLLEKEAIAGCSHVLADINMLLNHAFLIKRENEDRFSYLLNKLDNRFGGLINFRLVGPLPPYSFATVVIDALDKQTVKNAQRILNLNGEVSQDKIKKAYNKLSFQLHPDRGGDAAEFAKVTKNYQLLRKYAKQGLVGVSVYQWKDSDENCYGERG